MVHHGKQVEKMWIYSTAPITASKCGLSKVHILRCDKIEKPAAREQHHFTPWDKHMLLYIFGLIVIKTKEQKKHFTIEQ